MMLILSYILLLLSINVNAQQVRRQDCVEVCDPSGATSQVLPAVGASLADLYADLISTVNGEGGSTGPAKRQESSAVFCCALKNDCYLLQNYDVPFCYDNYTTGFNFPDGTYGSLVRGVLTIPGGTVVDLVYGNYNDSDGSTGNIYSEAAEPTPETSTMLIPSPWTSSGVGTAVPASELGEMTSIASSSTSVSDITVDSLTITAGPSACTECLGSHTIVPGLTGLSSLTTALDSTTGITASANRTASATPSRNTSTSGASFVFPPINQGWTGIYTAFNGDYTLFLCVFVIGLALI